MLGWLLNTLSYRLRRELREWHKTNQTLRENAWPWYQKALIAAGKHPVWVPFGLFWITLLLSAAAWGYQVFCMPLTGSPPSSLFGLERQRFFTLWTIQATIAAMIYPIVIGFVALLLQRRHSAKASLQIYLHDSAAILTGLSALFLVMAMGVQYFFITITGKQVLAKWLILDGIWFLANILGVIRFLTGTFDYLRPERRADIVRAYAINHVWPEEMRRNLKYHLFLGAIDNGWLPGPNYRAEGSITNTAILTDPYGRYMGDVQVTEQKKDKWYIHDVRLRFLSWAVSSWQRRGEKLVRSQKGQQDSFAGLSRPWIFILPFAPGMQFDATYGLCRTDGGTGLRWWEQWLVRQSFVLAPKEKKPVTLSVSDILNGLIVEAQIAIEASAESTFREALGELVDLHAALINSCNFITDSGQRDNFANLVNSAHFTEARIYDLWAREYRHLLEATVDRLPVSDTYFNHMVHVPGRLIGQLKAVRPIAIPCHYFRLSRYLHYRLNRWWTRTTEEQGLLHHGPCEPVTLRAPTFALYDAAIKAYVGAWESLKNHHLLPSREEAMTWEQYGEIRELYTGHLDSTLYILFDSLSLGNKDGAEWLCDSLIKWWDTISFRFENTRYYIRDTRKLTLELTQKPWEVARDVVDFSMHDVDESNAPKALWSACIHNYWIDLCYISLYAMIQFGKACKCEGSLPAQLAGNLGKGRALRAGGEAVGSQWPLQTFEDLLIAIIRQYYLDGGYLQGYRARMDEVVERIFEQGKPDMVPGRVYSESGVKDLDSLSDGQLVLLCLLIQEGWTPSSRLMEIIQKWGGEDDAGLRGFTKQLEQWKTRLNNAGFQEYEYLFSCIQANFGASENLVDATTALNDVLGRLISVIEGFRDEQLRDVQISDERLKDVARWSSRSAFCKDKGDVPVSLFRKVKYSKEEYTEHSLIIRDMNKEQFVEPPMAQRAINEEEWFDRTISSYVAGSVMADTLKFLSPETIDVDGPLAYWGQIQIATSIIRNAGGTPILLVAGPAEPRWLLDWEISNYDEDVERPDGLRLVRDKQFESVGYVASLNDIPVFVAPIAAGSSYLISGELLDTMRVTELEDGVFVKASVEPIQGKSMLINLRLVWRFKLDLGPSECWQLRYSQSSE